MIIVDNYNLKPISDFYSHDSFPDYSLIYTLATVKYKFTRLLCQE